MVVINRKEFSDDGKDVAISGVNAPKVYAHSTDQDTMLLEFRAPGAIKETYMLLAIRDKDVENVSMTEVKGKKIYLPPVTALEVITYRNSIFTKKEPPKDDSDEKGLDDILEGTDADEKETEAKAGTADTIHSPLDLINSYRFYNGVIKKKTGVFKKKEVDVPDTEGLQKAFAKAAREVYYYCEKGTAIEADKIAAITALYDALKEKGGLATSEFGLEPNLRATFVRGGLDKAASKTLALWMVNNNYATLIKSKGVLNYELNPLEEDTGECDEGKADEADEIPDGRISQGDIDGSSTGGDLEEKVCDKKDDRKPLKKESLLEKVRKSATKTTLAKTPQTPLIDLNDALVDTINKYVDLGKNLLKQDSKEDVYDVLELVRTYIMHAGHYLSDNGVEDKIPKNTINMLNELEARLALFEKPSLRGDDDGVFGGNDEDSKGGISEDEGLSLIPGPMPLDTDAPDAPGKLNWEYECPTCGAPVPADAMKCTECGEVFEEDEKSVGPIKRMGTSASDAASDESDDSVYECPECSADVPANAKVCPRCSVEFLE